MAPPRFGKKNDLPLDPGAALFRSTGDDAIASAVTEYVRSEADRDPEVASGGRAYRSGEVFVVLTAFALAMGMLDSEGLLKWAKRMNVGAAQGVWLATLTPAYGALDRAGLTAPRRLAEAAADWISGAFGAGEDPLLAGGWAKELATAPAELPPPAVPEPPVAEEPSPPKQALAAVPPLDASALMKGDRVKVLLIGDSMMAGSLGTALSRALERDPHFEVSRATQSGTGLSQPEAFDWMKVVVPLVERDHPRLVICSLGANDAQNIRKNGRQLEFGGSPWKSAYRERVLSMMRVLAGKEAHVLWLALPPMRGGKLASRVEQLNAVFAAAARKVPRVEYLELGMLVSEPDGRYATFVEDADDRPVRFRMDDGVHYSPSGAKVVARWIVDWIYNR